MQRLSSQVLELQNELTATKVDVEKAKTKVNTMAAEVATVVATVKRDASKPLIEEAGKRGGRKAAAADPTDAALKALKTTVQTLQTNLSSETKGSLLGRLHELEERVKASTLAAPTKEKPATAKARAEAAAAEAKAVAKAAEDDDEIWKAIVALQDDVTDIKLALKKQRKDFLEAQGKTGWGGSRPNAGGKKANNSIANSSNVGSGSTSAMGRQSRGSSFYSDNDDDFVDQLEVRFTILPARLP